MIWQLHSYINFKKALIHLIELEGGKYIIINWDRKNKEENSTYS